VIVTNTSADGEGPFDYHGAVEASWSRSNGGNGTGASQYRANGSSLSHRDILNWQQTYGNRANLDQNRQYKYRLKSKCILSLEHPAGKPKPGVGHVLCSFKQATLDGVTGSVPKVAFSMRLLCHNDTLSFRQCVYVCLAYN
jgi:hypothetical protein